jgi:hypothetical protein
MDDPGDARVTSVFKRARYGRLQSYIRSWPQWFPRNDAQSLYALRMERCVRRVRSFLDAEPMCHQLHYPRSFRPVAPTRPALAERALLGFGVEPDDRDLIGRRDVVAGR